MANKSLTVDQLEYAKVLKKIKELGGVEETFHQELEKTATDIQTNARNKFKAGALPLLERRGEDTRGLVSSIKKKTLKRKKGKPAFQIVSGSRGKKIMAFAEFGTRSRNINLSGIRSLFGSQGDSYAVRFKGGDNPKNFTNLDARPYFYTTVFEENKKLMNRLQKKIKQTIRK